MIVEPFYNLLCAGEEKKAKYIGAKMLDAGDIIQTVAGWTVIGYGKSQIPLIRFPFELTRNFRKKVTETHKGIEAMDEAISELSVRCNPADSRRALYLISSPAREMNMDLIKDLGNYLRDIAPEAIIRSGDYPRERGVLNISVILSDLKDVEKVRNYFSKSASIMRQIKSRQAEMKVKLEGIEEASKDVPSLL